MTEPTDIDALIADLRNEKWEAEALARRVHTRLYKRAADALESTLAELRQEGERADKAEAWTRRLKAHRNELQNTRDYWENLFRKSESDLARAREVIDRMIEKLADV